MHGWAPLRRPLLLALALLALLPVMTALGTGRTEPGADPETNSGSGLAADSATLTGAAEYQVALTDAADLYAMNCSVCHGPTGGGLAEARLVFPPEERHCTRCHKPNNPVVQPLTRPFVDNDMFPVGEAPALRAVAPPSAGAEPEGAAGGRQALPHTPGAPLAAVAPPEALFAYVKATMPRYDPGRHTDAEYWLLAAHLFDLNGRSTEAANAVAAAVATGWTP